MSSSRFLTGSFVLAVLLVSCAQPPIFCPAVPRRDLQVAVAFVNDDQFAYQFPLDEVDYGAAPYFTDFCANSSGPESARKYHAAEDFFLPAGTPVYAMADGKISYSGPMGGYGWLIIIDHPQANIYSLYGHLSPSRWRMRSGTVEKGELSAYLGDADENGGSASNPLRPHLHLGVRAGQRADYSGMGEWRWQAGWIKPCPQSVGWLQPSALITDQQIPAGGFPEPVGFFAKWGVELLLVGVYMCGAGGMLVYATKQGKPFAPVFCSGMLIAAGWILGRKGVVLRTALYMMAALCLTVGIRRLLRRSVETQRAESQRTTTE